ncbi:MAG TPA: hypothetical protein PLL19_14550, partial [Thiobacillaceae bacterium]|nr:hypothetical protein [Thiobacillaceae bacterium]
MLRQYTAKVGGVRMLTPEEKARLMPALIKILEALYEKGAKTAKALIAQAQARLKKHDDEFVRTHWNKITQADYADAAQQAIENIESRDQQGDLFTAAAKLRVIPWRRYSTDRLNRWMAEAVPQAQTSDGTQLSRHADTAGSIALRDLNAVVDRVRNGMANLPNVHVLSSPDALDMNNPAQARLRRFIEEAGAMEDVEGATHEGEIYLFASGLADEARAEHVLATHEVTHYGLRAVFGMELDPVLQSIWATNANIRKKSAALRETLGLSSNVAAVEEVLADMAPRDLIKLKGWRRLVGVVRDWLRAHGFTALADRLDGWMKTGLTDQQRADLLVAEVVNAARSWVQGGKRMGKVASGTALADVRTLAEDLPAQEKWLNTEARARGFKDIDDLAAKDYKAFENLAKLWRKKHPADAMM